jgi:hypothetical protein
VVTEDVPDKAVVEIVSDEDMIVCSMGCVGLIRQSSPRAEAPTTAADAPAHFRNRRRFKVLAIELELFRVFTT